MEREPFDTLDQISAEYQRLGVTAAASAASALNFALPSAEYLALLRALPDGAGYGAVEEALRALVPPEFSKGWDTQPESERGV